MADLVTEYLGLQLASPLVLASSALSNRLENLEAAEGQSWRDIEAQHFHRV